MAGRQGSLLTHVHTQCHVPLNSEAFSQQCGREEAQGTP